MHYGVLVVRLILLDQILAAFFKLFEHLLLHFLAVNLREFLQHFDRLVNLAARNVPSNQQSTGQLYYTTNEFHERQLKSQI